LPYAESGDIRIHYEVMGTGFPLVLQHGMTSNTKIWMRHGYVDSLSKRYKLILIDARGHGESDKPHDPEKYRIEYMVDDVTSVLDDLEIDRSHFFGYSMGGRIGLAAGRYAQHRFCSLVIGGNGLKEKDSVEQIRELQAYSSLFKQGTDAVIAEMEKRRGRKLDDWELDKWLQNDLKALDAYCSLYENIEMVDFLPGVMIPCLLFAGSLDTYPHGASMRCAELMPNARFLSLPGLNHGNALRQSSVVLPYVLEFLDQATQKME
jgi:pimeloyl-ACP methyl ester carboxylesterase